MRSSPRRPLIGALKLTALMLLFGLHMAGKNQDRSGSGGGNNRRNRSGNIARDQAEGQQTATTPGVARPNNGNGTYEAAPYHGRTDNAVKNKAPENGQAALDNSVQIKDASTRRVGVDKVTGEITIFDETHNGTGIYHGHVRSWGELRPEMQSALIKAGLVNRKGQIL